MGTAHIQISSLLLDELLVAPYNKLLTIESHTDFGDGSVTALVASDALPPGYHGVQELILSFEKIGFDTVKYSVKFRRETDT